MNQEARLLHSNYEADSTLLSFRPQIQGRDLKLFPSNFKTTTGQDYQHAPRMSNPAIQTTTPIEPKEQQTQEKAYQNA
jgi:hypothetical protein